MGSRAVSARDQQLVQRASEVVLAGAADPRDDAAAERQRASFDSTELTRFLNGGEDKLARRCASRVAACGAVGRRAPPLAAAAASAACCCRRCRLLVSICPSLLLVLPAARSCWT